jgi:hypothetical protein
MAPCRHSGLPVDAQARICPHCGGQVRSVGQNRAVTGFPWLDRVAGFVIGAAPCALASRPITTDTDTEVLLLLAAFLCLVVGTLVRPRCRDVANGLMAAAVVDGATGLGAMVVCFARLRQDF